MEYKKSVREVEVHLLCIVAKGYEKLAIANLHSSIQLKNLILVSRHLDLLQVLHPEAVLVRLDSIWIRP